MITFTLALGECCIPAEGEGPRLSGLLHTQVSLRRAGMG